MFDHELNPRKGWVGDRGLCLEKTLPIATQTNPVYAGCVVHVTSSNTFELGVLGTGTSTSTGSPPLFAFQNENDFDVNPDLGNIAGGVLMALSCLGDFELESTEIADSQTFAVGDYLTSDDGSGGSGTGAIQKGTLGTDIICGIVSEIDSDSADGTFTNEAGQSVVRFWTWFMPSEISVA